MYPSHQPFTWLGPSNWLQSYLLKSLSLIILSKSASLPLCILFSHHFMFIIFIDRTFHEDTDLAFLASLLTYCLGKVLRYKVYLFHEWINGIQKTGQNRKRAVKCKGICALVWICLHFKLAPISQLSLMGASWSFFTSKLYVPQFLKSLQLCLPMSSTGTLTFESCQVSNNSSMLLHKWQQPAPCLKT